MVGTFREGIEEVTEKEENSKKVKPNVCVVGVLFLFLIAL